MLRLLDGRQDLMHFCYHLANFRHSEAICSWLLIHGFKGERLAEWLSERFEGKTLELVKYVVSQVNRTNGVRPIIVGVDYAAK